MNEPPFTAALYGSPLAAAQAEIKYLRHLLFEARSGLSDVQGHLRIVAGDSHRLSTTYVICERALARSKE